jgi:GrpB-like predicted nucleotidyltransferase (UPF0157 family)/GNAT superfamily N-acetyltransferase
VDDEDRDAYLDEVLVGGRERRAIVVVDYDLTWPQQFERERARIASALGASALGIEHIGSTSVPGLAAKPVVDVLVIVADPEDEAAFAPALIVAGYEVRVREPAHRLFRTPGRDVHVHVRAVTDPEVDRHLLFRDRLRQSPEDRYRYEQLKRTLARRTWDDMNHYADAKGRLIEEILAGARGPVRPAAPGDADAIAPLLGELGYPTDPREVGARLTDLLQRDGEGALVYDRDGDTVGLLTWQLTHLIYRSAPQLRITALVVRSDQRRRGVATELLAAVERIASEQGCIRLELTTRPRRADAAALYESAGFEERPRRLVKQLDPR